LSHITLSLHKITSLDSQLCNPLLYKRLSYTEDLLARFASWQFWCWPVFLLLMISWKLWVLAGTGVGSSASSGGGVLVFRYACDWPASNIITPRNSRVPPFHTL
jgi:hypothetical protein